VPLQLPRNAAGQEERGEDDRQRRDGDPWRLRPPNERADLGERDTRADPEQHLPRAPDRDERKGGEDEGDEGDADARQAGVESEQPRSGHRADQPEDSDQLGVPGQCHGEARRGDACGEHQPNGLRDEVVHRGRRQQRDVAARDACAYRSQRRRELSVALPDEEAGAEDGRRRGGAQRDARDRTDPAVVHGEDEEEDDSEERHDPAGQSEAAGSE